MEVIFHSKERKLVQDYLNCYKKQLESTPINSGGLYGHRNYKYIELKSKIELCERLLNG